MSVGFGVAPKSDTSDRPEGDFCFAYLPVVHKRSQVPFRAVRRIGFRGYAKAIILS